MTYFKTGNYKAPLRLGRRKRAHFAFKTPPLFLPIPPFVPGTYMHGGLLGKRVKKGGGSLLLSPLTSPGVYSPPTVYSGRDGDMSAAVSTKREATHHLLVTVCIHSALFPFSQVSRFKLQEQISTKTLFSRLRRC